jgi:DNA-binding CsgD family transcriptional regulator
VHLVQQHAIAAVRRACATAGAGEEVFTAVARLLRDAVGYDGALWFGADPSTWLATSPVLAENIENGHCETYWRREFLVEDALLFRDVARAKPPVGALRAVLADNPRRSARYRECIAPQGYDDELRAAFQVDGETWGLVSLFRERGRPSFSADDTAVVGELLAPVAEALRRTAVLTRPAGGGEPEEPGLMMFDAHGVLLSLNDPARAWLDELPVGPLTSDGVPLPTQVMASVARARAIAEGREQGQARLRVRSRSGRWLVVHASSLRLADGSVGDTALVIEPARAAEIAPLIVTAYELSRREQEIVQLVARGRSTQEIASTLFLSPHTVRDHLKAIFEKVGVSSRGELVAKVFAEHYEAPLLHAAHD